MAQFIPENYSFEIESTNISELHPGESIKFTIIFHQTVTADSPQITKVGFNLTVGDMDAYHPQYLVASRVDIEEPIGYAENFNYLTAEFTTLDSTIAYIKSTNPVIHNTLYGFTDTTPPPNLILNLVYLESSVDNVIYGQRVYSVDTYVPIIVSKKTYLSIEPSYQQITVGAKNCQEDTLNQLRINEEWTVSGLFPIGSIHLTTDDKNPSEYFGGQWEPYGSGRTLVCVDSNDSDFSSSQLYGGEKTHELTINEMPSHTHKNYYKDNSVASGNTADRTLAYASGQETYYNTYVGIGTPHNNLQPYIVCYMWLRAG